MRNILKKIIVVLVLCTVLASTVGFVSADAATKQTKTEEKAMKKAYKKKLKKLFSSYKKDEYISGFALYYKYLDMDSDGIDEMIAAKSFESGFDSYAYIFKIYKYVDGKVIDMTKKIDTYFTQFIFSKDYEYLYTGFQGDAYEADVYKRSGNYYKKVAYAFDGEETVYELYDKKAKGLKEVSESEFFTYYNKYKPEATDEKWDWELYDYWINEG